MLMKLYYFLIKTMLCIILFLIFAIICKSNTEYSQYFYDNIYNQSLSFSYFRNFYNNYLGGIFPIDDILESEGYVFSEKLEYSGITAYEDGALLTVDNSYLVPNLQDGIIVYIGEKEKYGNVIIIEGDGGVDIWYGNICNYSVNLYDSVDKGTYLGEACSDNIYLVYSIGNEFLDYRDYLST